MRSIINRILKKRIAVFHHIPKCGGSSLRRVLVDWFEFHPEYRELDWNEDTLRTFEKIPLNNLGPRDCVSAHWDVPGFHLKDRYPNILSDRRRHFLFTFLRDPLEVKISLYYFELKKGRQLSNTLEERIFAEDNYIADRFPCDESNYKQVLNRYDFVGFVESYQESMDRLAYVLEKPKIKITQENISARDNEANLSSEIINEFKRRNQLDYKIYRYCQEKFLNP